MSIPIVSCFFLKALNDEKAFEKLISTLKYNQKFGSMCFFDCPHDPPCRELTDEECDILTKRIEKALKGESNG